MRDRWQNATVLPGNSSEESTAVLIFMQGWEKKKKIVFAIQAKCTGIWHLLISGWFYMALAKQPLTGKRNRNYICQEAEMYPKKTLEALQGVIPVQRTLWRQCGPGKGDFKPQHYWNHHQHNPFLQNMSCFIIHFKEETENSSEKN